MDYLSKYSFKNRFLFNPIQLSKILLGILCIMIMGNSLFKSDLKIIEAKSENWSSGMAGGGRGTEYYFKIKIQTSLPLVFDSVWVNNKMLPTYLANKGISISQSPIKFSKNDTVLLRVSDLSTISYPNAKCPAKCKAEATLRYLLNGKTKYQSINNITRIQSTKRQ